MPEKRISRVAIKRILFGDEIEIRAEAEVSLSGSISEISSPGIRIPRGAGDARAKEIEDAQLAELRKQLYAAGYSKRAIATAVKDVVRVDSRAN